MRRSSAVLCALVLAVISSISLRYWLNSLIPPLDSLTLVQGRVLQPARPCIGPAKYATFSLVLLVGDHYQPFVLSCDERVRAAAVGGTQVVLGLAPAPSGPSRWRVWTATVDGKEVRKYASERPWSYFELASFAVFSVMYLILAGAVTAKRQPLGRSIHGD